MRAISGFQRSADFARYSYTRNEEARYFVLSEEELACWSGPNQDLSSFERSYDVSVFQTNLVKTLKDFYPNPRILIVTRGFKAMVQSLYAQYANVGSRVGFLDFIESKNGQTLVELLNYDKVINQYIEAFGAERVIILPYELMRDDPKKFLDVLCQKLDVPVEDFPHQKINNSQDTAKLEDSIQLSRLVFKLLAITGKKRNNLFTFYAISLMQRKFDWALPLGRMFGKRPNLESEYADKRFAHYLLQFKGKGEFTRAMPLFENYRKEYFF